MRPPLTAESTAVYLAVKVCGPRPTKETTPPAVIMVLVALQRNVRSTGMAVLNDALPVCEARTPQEMEEVTTLGSMACTKIPALVLTIAHVSGVNEEYSTRNPELATAFNL